MTLEQGWAVVWAICGVAFVFFVFGYLCGWLSDSHKEAFARRWAATGIRQDRAFRARLRARRHG